MELGVASAVNSKFSLAAISSDKDCRTIRSSQFALANRVTAMLFLLIWPKIKDFRGERVLYYKNETAT